MGFNSDGKDSVSAPREARATPNDSSSPTEAAPNSADKRTESSSAEEVRCSAWLGDMVGLSKDVIEERWESTARWLIQAGIDPLRVPIYNPLPSGIESRLPATSQDSQLCNGDTPKECRPPRIASRSQGEVL